MRQVSRRTLGGLAALALALVVSASARPASAQATARPGAAPPPPDTRPLARYVANGDLGFYFEWAGLDAHAEAWKASATYKLLNETTLGEMLRDVATQVIEYGTSGKADRKLNGAEIVSLIEHVARHGAMVAEPVDKEKRDLGVIVLRGGAKKEIRSVMSRFVASFAAPGIKAQQIKRGSAKNARTVMFIPKPAGGGWAWWPEGDDIVIVESQPAGEPGGVDRVLDVIDGKLPNAVEHPMLAELTRVDDGFEPVGALFVNFAAMQGISEAESAGTAKFAAGVVEAGLTRVDHRIGFQGEALVGVTRVAAPSPRKGALAMLDDQPGFSRDSLPPLPAGLTGFMALSIAPAKLYDQVVALVPPGSPTAGKIADADRAVKEKTKLRLRDDILARIGPKMAFYAAPGAASAGFNPMALLGGAGGALPKLTMITEIDDADKVGKTVDQLMVVANQALRDRVQAPAPPPGGPGRPPAGGRPGGGTGAPQFKPSFGSSKSYVLTTPAGGASPLPAGAQPTVRIGPKHMAIAISPDAARAALEIKPTELYRPPSELAATFEKLPPSMLALIVDDPRNLLPGLIPLLPAMVQMAANGGAGLPGMPPAAAQPADPKDAPPRLVINVDPAKVPTADAVRERLFPGATSVSVDEKGLTITTRDAFPNVVSPAGAMMTALLLPAVQSARNAARMAAGMPSGMPGAAVAPAAAPGGNAGGAAPSGPGPDGRFPGGRGRPPGVGAGPGGAAPARPD